MDCCQGDNDVTSVSLYDEELTGGDRKCLQ